jgi:quercetin dioxygenase-like cupin family protein
VEPPSRPPSAKGPAEWFTGDVWIEPIASGRDGSELNVAAVHFSPGARTAWHAHSRGQTLAVTEGEGVVQTRGEAAVPLRAGDVTYTPADEWHWHGAAPNHLMTHLSITEGSAEWGDHVTDDELGRP